MKRYAWGAFTMACCAIGFYLRWRLAHADLNAPSVDENDVVQQGVAFMGGQWKYYLLEYGALPMYCLAALYHGVARLRGLTPLEYAERVFYSGAEQYLLARLFCAACFLPLAIASYRYLTPRFGRSAGLVAALLLSLPVVDALTKGTVRIDVPQGACQLAALLFLAKTLESKSWRNWLGAGVFAGLGMACKPLPGALLAPCFWAASWFAAAAAVPSAPPRSPGALLAGLRSWGLRLWRSLSHPALWVAGATAIAVAVLANPTALDVREFISGQMKATDYYSGPGAPGRHLTAFQALKALDWKFHLSLALCVLVMPFVRDKRARLITLFPLLYALAFTGRPVRTYYMVAPMMAMCLVIAICVSLALGGLGLDAPGARAAEAEPSRLPARAPSARAFAFGGALSLALVSALAWRPLRDLADYWGTVTSQTRAREWIHQNIPSGTRLFQYGTYAAGPRLVAASWGQEAKFADFFDYGRDNYEFYQRAARQAYEDYRNAGRPYYELDMFGATPEPAERARPWLSSTLVKRALKNRQEYIVLAARTPDYRGLGYRWFEQVELAQQLGTVAVFRVPGTEPASVPAVAGVDGAGG